MLLDFAMPHFSERELDLPALEFPKIFERVIHDRSVISLAQGEPSFSTPKPLLQYAKKVLPKSTHYAEPQGMLELREAICKKLKKENNIHANPENILVTCGSQEALFAALLATIDPTEQVIMPSPGYVGYLPAIELVNGVPVFMRLDQENNFAVDPDSMKKIIDKRRTKVLILNTPSNPTGTVLSKSILEEIATISREYDLHVFVDEAYEQLTFEKTHVSLASLNGVENISTFQTFSKSYAMCGFRLGYMVSSEKLIREVNKVHHYITLSAPALSQYVGIKALSLKKSYVHAMVREYKKRRDVLVKRLNALHLKTVSPDGAFYTFSNIEEHSKNSVKFSRMLLDKAKVAVIPGTEFGPFGEGFIRCSFATDLKKIVLALDRMEKVLKK